MPAQVFDLIDSGEKHDAIEQGADFAWSVTFRAADTDGTQAADWLARMQVRRAYADAEATAEPLLDLDSDTLGGIAVSITADQINGDAVTMDVHVPAADTVGLPAGRWYYDLELVRVADDYVRRVAKGRVQVTAEVTRG